ncbi:hypothetical protein WA158_006304 [Blastocystis sp. Blastoise]
MCGCCSLPCFLCSQINKRATNFSYLSYLVVTVILCIIFQCLPENDVVNSGLMAVFGYKGIQLVYRVSLGSCLSFVVMSLLTCAFPFLHHVCVFLFTVIYVVFVAVCLWAFKSETFIYTYRSIAKWISVVYLVIQLGTIIDMSYIFHDMLDHAISDYEKRKGYREGESPVCANQYKLFYLVISFLLFLGSLAFNISFYFIFSSAEAGISGLYVLFISISLILGIVILVVSIVSPNPAGFLPPSITYASVTLYLYIALLSNPDKTMNPLSNVSWIWIEILCIIVCLLLAAYYSFRIQPAYTDETLSKTKDAEVGKTKISVQAEDSRLPALYHLSNALLSVYIGILTSFWYEGDITIFPAITNEFMSTSIFWIYSISVWVGFAIYFWTLIAPFIMKNRDFS